MLNAAGHRSSPMPGCIPPGQTIPNAVIAKVGTNGNVCIVNSQPLQLVADITGYFP